MPRAEDLLAADFPPTSHEEWRRRVEAELDGVAFEKALCREGVPGLVRQPLYTASDLAGDDPAGFPGLPPFVRGPQVFNRGWLNRGWLDRGWLGRGWQVAREVRDPEEVATLEVPPESGVELVWLDLAGEPLRQALARLDLKRLSVVATGADALAVSELLLAEAEHQDVACQDLRGGFGCDPLARCFGLRPFGRCIASPEDLDRAFEQAAALVDLSRREAPGVRALLVDLSPYHDAGADAVQELAFLAASGVEVLRRLNAADPGLGMDAVADSLLFAASVGSDFFTEIAKLRAARLLWSKVGRACGVSEQAQALRLHARTSAVSRTVGDPWTNQLRGTTQSFAAAVGGADSIATAPFDDVPDASNRRLAVNAQHVLREEAGLDQVLDPAGGSYYVERWTDELARAAWTLFQEIERRGGMARCLLDGWIRERIESTDRRVEA